MELSDVIKIRRSVRSFNSREVDPIKVENMIKSAFWAPSSDRSRALNIFVVKEKDTINKLAMSTSYSFVLKAVGTVIVVGYDSSSGNFFEEDTAFAAMNIILSATDQGLSSCYVQLHKETGAYGNAEDYTKRVLNAPDKIRIAGAIAVGYTDQTNTMPHTESEIIRKNIHYNLYGIH